MKRKVVRIIEDRCNGCGECIPSCAEGALRIVDGKARLVGDALCDGLGACLGECPQGAIVIEEREAVAFDENAVKEHLEEHHPEPGRAGHHQTSPGSSPRPTAATASHQGCPGTRLRNLALGDPRPENIAADSFQQAPSRLGQWPVQLHLLPVESPLWHDKDVLIAADCVPFAMADFHDRLLAGRAVAIGCPKLDDLSSYTRKLTEIFRQNSIRSVTVATMEVPCCHGLLMATRQALAAAEKGDVPLYEVRVSVRGELQTEAPPPIEA